MLSGRTPSKTPKWGESVVSQTLPDDPPIYIYPHDVSNARSAVLCVDSADPPSLEMSSHTLRCVYPNLVDLERKHSHSAGTQLYSQLMTEFKCEDMGDRALEFSDHANDVARIWETAEKKRTQLERQRPTTGSILEEFRFGTW